MSGRTQVDRLAALTDRLSERDHAIVGDVVRLRFLTAAQLTRLHFDTIEQPVTRRRRSQRTLARLVEHGLLLRCGRRVGGVRAGSAGFTYAPTAEAIRAVNFRAGQSLPRARRVLEPGTSFVDHTVAVNEVYVDLIEAGRRGELELLDHQAEPDCWRRFVGGMGEPMHLRPDAFVALSVGEFEERSFVEVDRGSEGSTALRRKLGLYLTYWRAGAEQQRHGIFPRIVWQVSNQRRAAALRGLVAELPIGDRRLFAICQPEDTSARLRGIAAVAGGQT